MDRSDPTNLIQLELEPLCTCQGGAGQLWSVGLPGGAMATYASGAEATGAGLIAGAALGLASARAKKR